PVYYFDNFFFEEATSELYFEDFDDFADGDYLAVVDPDNWTTWTDAPGTAEDALITDAFAESAPNAVLVEGTTDAVFPCGDFTSGEYGISFDYYIPSGMAGYYNVQHIFASEWALEVYLHADGSTRVIAGGLEVSDVTFTPDTWFNVAVEIDMDGDDATMYWDGVEVINWQWSLKTDGTPGANQLGCVNMYAGAEGSDTPEYYFDNFSFVSLSSGLLPPTIELDIDEMTVAIADGLAVTEPFNVANVGEQDLSYYAYPVYDITETTGSGTDVMHYDGDFDTGIGSDAAVQRKVAVLFLPSMVEDYIGMALTSADFYVDANAIDFQVKIWGAGSTTTPGPGEELLSMSYNPTVGSWNTVVLDDAFIMDGSPIWIGCEYFQPAATYSFGADVGPQIPGVNFSSTGPGWSELSLDRNWNIRGNLTGDIYNTFLDIPVDMGMLIGGDDENVMVFFDPTGLAPDQYFATVVVESNDAVTNYSYIDVTLDIITAVNDLEGQDAVMLYPNPSADMVFVRANSLIKEVRVSNYLGQLVDVYSFMNEEANIDISNYDTGVYFVEVTTVVGKHTMKVVKK
ncbi:MAG: T9SS type A sorting domain-containing protein, partial [Bacteroidales bacterium]|nr:T9SS type A sorting domain-containing protein [Bacteroidales bacterium]